MFLEGKVTQIAIGQIRGFVKPSKAERAAAFELFVELSVRVTTVSIDDQRGTMRDTFDNLTAIGNVTREILRKHGCDSAKGRKDGNITLAAVALRVLNEIIAPRLITWESLLRDYESQRNLQEPVPPPGEWEGQWDNLQAATSDLDDMRREIRSYMDTLAAIAGTPSLTDLVVPLPPSAPINTVTLENDFGAVSDDVPRKKMVRWFSPLEALGTMRANRGHHPNAPGGRAPVYGHEYVPITIEPGADGTTWIDYVSDLGDAFDPTMAVAFQLTRQSLKLPIDRSGELPDPPTELPRGALLVMGGDEVYPHATAEGYRRQLILPYQMAARARTGGGAPPDPQQNSVVAIPGNHDWYGGHEHFEEVFAKSDVFAEHWATPQKERWWAVQLPHGWWMWGIDTALDNTIDDEQKEYFRQAAEQLGEGDQVIICSPVPLWQLRQKREEEYFELRALLSQLIMQRGARTPLFLSGDSHFFAHYRRVDGVADEHHITAGGGGAFMQPTHNLPEQVPYERGAPDFKLDARWPRPVESRALGTDLGNIRDPQFRSLFAIIAVVHAAFAGLISIRAGALQKAGLPVKEPGVAARWVIAAWPGWPILALLLVAMMMVTAPNSRESHLVKGSKRYGLLHGAAQAMLFVAVAAFARVVGPDAWWWRFMVVPLIGGVLSTVLFVMAVRWINQSIKANDTLAFSSAHLTRYKHFVRMRITSSGDLDLYVIGVDPVGQDWYAAMTTPGALVPPYDRTAGVPKLHYVWGHSFANGSYQQVVDRHRTLGRDHPDTLYALASFGRRELAAGSLPSAIEALSTAVAAAEIVHGVNHHTTLAYRDSLADALAENGDFESAIALLQAAVDARTAQDMAAAEKSQTTSVPRRVTVDSLVRLGLAYSAAGRPYEAANQFEEALAALRSHEGLGTRADEAELQCHLAVALMDSDRDWQAAEFIDECVASLAEALGDEHEMTRLAVVTRAQLRINALQYLGRADGGPDTPEERKTRASAAIEELAAVLTEDLADLPENHPAHIAVRRALANAHRENGYPEGAKMWLEQNARILQQMDGEAARAARVQNADALIEVLTELRLDGDSVAHRRQVIADREAMGGSEAGYALALRYFLASTLGIANDRRAAVEELNELLDRCAQDPVAPRGLAEQAKVELANQLLALNDLPRAIEILGDVRFDDLVALSWADTPTKVRSLHTGALYSHGDDKAAIDLLRAAWKPFSDLGTPLDEERLALCLQLADGLYRVQQGEELIVLLEPRLDAFVQCLGAGHPDTLHATERLAELLTWSHRAADAVALLEHCLATRTADPSAGPLHVRWCEHLLRDAADAVGDRARALDLARRLAAFAREEFGADSEAELGERRAIARLTLPDDPATAASLLEAILDVSERVYGPSHPVVQADRGSLAEALEAAGELQRSLDECEQLLRVAVEHFADNPALLWFTRHAVARLSAQLGDFPRTIALCDENLAAEPVSADLRRNRVQTKLMQADAYRATGRLDDAARTIESALVDASAHLPRSHPIRALCDERSAEIRAAQTAAAGAVAPDA